ncbi:hypothetical protein V6N11_028589 [Hibiscus sabdariffa]|uniref:Uncharacterized protein n=1 Tax=Hibiscus sabdariffa TaxID=183260 RepID=A0ABR2NA07_9ROSI
MTTSSSSEGMPRQPANTEIEARYTRMATRNRWEEQGQPARANLNWVIEFHTNNAEGEDNVTVRGRRVVANSAIINEILGLPNTDSSIYALLRGLEDED